MTLVRYDKNHRRSRAIVHDKTVYFAGQVADDFKADIATQTAQALAKIDKLLADVGGDRKNVVAATIWLRDIADFDAMNAIWDEWVDSENPPTRCCGQVIMADPDLRVEIIPIAALD
ncbi:RidA family protein (plasmid) [Agrobacterium tumefaciens]|uniref:RidA family protein n=1 Tax=Agrobacterium tumefaciens TaxID=358 RepID=UPI0021CF3FF8|nr:RidA family protein [Agrobacterium tumefaciens]NTZ64185.1 RidA family protein [Agrobacterium tumefaciens]UXT00172.1 RidA family protein [Agrobacterium tumefaciens]UXT52872.1 RidA family protein [Agrobacterium tumefaciens]UXT68932.1 RidA family protein [Agrobacterium tumefaciens]